MKKSKLFEGISQWELFYEKVGKKVKLPIFYYDCTSITAIYTASKKQVKKYLHQKDIIPVEILPGRCLITFTAFEYRKTDIGPYNEFSIAIPLKTNKWDKLNLYSLYNLLKMNFMIHIWHLPVTTEIARATGVEFYGYPKFLGKIKFSQNKSHIECQLSEGNEHILTLRGKKMKTGKGKSMKITTYSFRDKIPLLANVIINPVKFRQSFSPSSAELILGEKHPISRELKDINLSKNPIGYFYAPLQEAILFGPRNLIDT